MDVFNDGETGGPKIGGLLAVHPSSGQSGGAACQEVNP
jgi:hypothetical protein